MSESSPSRLMLAKVRHDMRTPINHILGYSELLAEDVDVLKPTEISADLEKIQMAAGNLLRMIDTHLSDRGFDELMADAAATAPADTAASVRGDEVLIPVDLTDPMRPVVTGRILVVDDNTDNRETLRRRLVKQGHVVEAAADGAVAMQRLRADAFDLVLLDILMPGIDGYAVLREIKSDASLRHLPVIMISALDEMESVVHCIESGAEDYLPKPFNPTLLRARIGASLEKKALRDEEQNHLKIIEETQNRLKHELDEAARYVRSIIPEPIATPVAIDWRYIPSTELGGDAFGYHQIDDEHLAIYLLDVCGHGVGAALLSVTAMNVIRSGSLADTDFLDPAQVLSALNEAFPMERQNNMYFTIWYGVWNFTDRTLTYASGGHPPALLLTPAGSTLSLRTPGLLIGAMEGAAYESRSIVVDQDSRLLVFSDGVYEISTAEGRMIEFEQFKDVAIAASREPDILGFLADWAFDLSSSPTLEDDYSILCVRF